ncbi:hypothetical protein RsTz2092_09960 [Deferribacterales bacterium RsTz2092]|nr:hypothetical protein AGMMS49941_08910 [Deferribacterales bacterium]
MFSEIWQNYDFDEISARIVAAGSGDVERALASQHPTIADLPALLSPAAESYIEEMARRSYAITRRRFGNAIQLYAPLYISNECSNGCLYCGFSAKNRDVVRRTLSLAEIENELKALSSMGISHTLLLTGEAPEKVNENYIAEAVKIARKYSDYIAIEVYPLSVDGYCSLVSAGVDGLTVYQETYDRTQYDKLHPFGKKRDIVWRLDAPDRGALAGMNALGVGALLGLSDARADVYFAALHADYLMKNYWRTQVSLSMPRICTAIGKFEPLVSVSDKMFVQFMTALRIILPDVGFMVSTRETADFRDNIMELGATQMSAGSSTEPGGYTAKGVSAAQFQIGDRRSVAEFSSALISKGLEPVVKDWDDNLHAGTYKLTSTEVPNIDGLTGLMDRSSFWVLAQRLFEEHKGTGKYISVLFIDIDNFKAVNDKFGHLAGDAVLSKIGSAIKSSVRMRDLACRYGGDEFIILITGMGEDVSVVADRLIKKIRTIQYDEPTSLHVTASIGVMTGAPTDADGFASYIFNADKALYTSKHEEGDRVSKWVGNHACDS